MMTDLTESESSYIGVEPRADEQPEEAIVPKLTEVKREKKARNLVDRAVFVSIKLGKPGASKKINSDRISFDSESVEEKDDILDGWMHPGEQAGENSDADEGNIDDIKARKHVDRKMISVSKKLIDCREYRAISTLDGKVKAYVKSRCTSSLVRNGIFLLPLALINEVDKKMEEFKTKRVELVEEYGSVYSKRVAEALERLGPEGDPSDYPAWEAIFPMFTFDMQYLSLQAPTVLGNINEKIFEREQEKVAGQFRSAVEMSLQSLRVGMAELVGSLADQLAANPTGKKKSVRKVSVEKVVDFLRVFDARNLADDTALADLVKKAKGLLEGADMQSLRTDDAIRDQVAKGFAEIKESLSTMIVEKPSRAITFDD